MYEDAAADATHAESHAAAITRANSQRVGLEGTPPLHRIMSRHGTDVTATVTNIVNKWRRRRSSLPFPLTKQESRQLMAAGDSTATSIAGSLHELGASNVSSGFNSSATTPRGDVVDESVLHEEALAFVDATGGGAIPSVPTSFGDDGPANGPVGTLTSKPPGARSVSFALGSANPSDEDEEGLSQPVAPVLLVRNSEELWEEIVHGGLRVPMFVPPKPAAKGLLDDKAAKHRGKKQKRKGKKGSSGKGLTSPYVKNCWIVAAVNWRQHLPQQQSIDYLAQLYIPLNCFTAASGLASAGGESKNSEEGSIGDVLVRLSSQAEAKTRNASATAGQASALDEKGSRLECVPLHDKRVLVDLHLFIQQLWSAKAHHDELCDYYKPARTPFPEFFLQWAETAFAGPVAAHAFVSMVLDAVAVWRGSDAEVNIFAKFLEGAYSTEQLHFYLFASRGKPPLRCCAEWWWAL